MSEKEAKGQVTFIAVVAVIIKVLLVLLIVATAIFEYWMDGEITTPQITDSTFYSSKVYYDSEAFDIEQLSLTFKKITLQQFQQSNGTNVIRCKNSHNYFEVTFCTTSKDGKTLSHNVVCDNSIVQGNLYSFLTDMDGDGYYETVLQFTVGGGMYVDRINVYMSTDNKPLNAVLNA